MFNVLPQDKTNQQTTSQRLHDQKETFLYLSLKAERLSAESKSPHHRTGCLLGGGSPSCLIPYSLEGGRAITAVVGSLSDPQCVMRAERLCGRASPL